MNGRFRLSFFIGLLFILLCCSGCGSPGSDELAAIGAKNYTISFSMVNSASGIVVNEIGVEDTIILNILVATGNGEPAVGRRIQVTFENNQCQFIDSSDGSSVTNADGEAHMRFKLVQGTTAGSEKITVTSDLPLGSTETPPAAAQNFTIKRVSLAGTIEFVSATPTLIGLSGSTNSAILPSQAVLGFIVKDSQTNPVYNQTVNFTLTTSPGGLALEPASAETDIDGKVTVVVKSGILPTAVRVRATVADNPSLTTLSGELILSTGFPDQNSFSISADILNPEAMSYDGEKVNITIRAGDINNNPVPDNTAIYFTTEGGSIQSSCFTRDGSCSVEWTSQDPRPDTPVMPLTHNGRVTIMAHTVGEESFQDLNGNGLFDSSSETLLKDLPEAFLDADENGTMDLGEKFIDFNGDELYTPADGIYNGTLCAPGSICSTDLVHVRDDIQIVMAESFANIQLSPSSPIYFNDIDDARPITITVSGINYGNSMPNGTIVVITPPDNAEIEGKSSFTVENTIGSNVFTILLLPKKEDALGTSGNLQVEVTTPKNNYTTISLGVTAPPRAEFVSSDGDPATHTVNFQDRSVSAPGTAIISWDWKFGDGSSSTLQNPSHAYSDDSGYQVTLTVTNSKGQSNTVSEDVTPPSPED